MPAGGEKTESAGTERLKHARDLMCSGRGIRLSALMVFLAAIVSIACAPSTGPTTPPVEAGCLSLKGEEIYGLDWSPNGRYLVVKSQETGRPQNVRRDRLRVFDALTSSWHDVVATRELLGAATVDDAGTAIWGQQNTETENETRILQETDATPREISRLRNVIALSWTSNGLVSVVRDDDGTATVGRIDDDGSNAVWFSTDDAGLSIWISNDGATVVMADPRPDTNVDVYTVRQNNVEKRLDPAERWSLLQGMSTDRKFVVYIRVDPETFDFAGLYRLPVAGGPPKPVSTEKSLGAIDISDQGRVAYAGFRGADAGTICFASASGWGL